MKFISGLLDYFHNNLWVVYIILLSIFPRMLDKSVDYLVLLNFIWIIAKNSESTLHSTPFSLNLNTLTTYLSKWKKFHDSINTQQNDSINILYFHQLEWPMKMQEYARWVFPTKMTSRKWFKWPLCILHSNMNIH